MHTYTRARTQIHLSKIVTAILALLQADSTKRNNIQSYILEQNQKFGYICNQFMLLAVTVIISSVILLVNIIVMSSITSVTSIFMLTFVASN